MLNAVSAPIAPSASCSGTAATACTPSCSRAGPYRVQRPGTNGRSAITGPPPIAASLAGPSLKVNSRSWARLASPSEVAAMISSKSALSSMSAALSAPSVRATDVMKTGRDPA